MNLSADFFKAPTPAPTSWFIERGREYQRLKDEGKVSIGIESKKVTKLTYNPSDITQDCLIPSFNNVLTSYMEIHRNKQNESR